jgi:hypothetical protein
VAQTSAAQPAAPQSPTVPDPFDDEVTPEAPTIGDPLEEESAEDVDEFADPEDLSREQYQRRGGPAFLGGELDRLEQAQEESVDPEEYEGAEISPETYQRPELGVPGVTDPAGAFAPSTGAGTGLPDVTGLSVSPGETSAPTRDTSTPGSVPTLDPAPALDAAPPVSTSPSVDAPAFADPFGFGDLVDPVEAETPEFEFPTPSGGGFGNPPGTPFERPRRLRLPEGGEFDELDPFGPPPADRSVRTGVQSVGSTLFEPLGGAGELSPFGDDSGGGGVGPNPLDGL